MHLKDPNELFQKIAWLIGFGVSICEILRVKILKKTAELAKYQNLVFSRVDILLIVAQNPIIHNIF